MNLVLITQRGLVMIVPVAPPSMAAMTCDIGSLFACAMESACELMLNGQAEYFGLLPRFSAMRAFTRSYT